VLPVPSPQQVVIAAPVVAALTRPVEFITTLWSIVFPETVELPPITNPDPAASITLL
jgi:hypothetical protein